MVLPVPCELPPLLKLETKMSPPASIPPGNPWGTKATPYGFTSPFGGTVETDSDGLEGRLAMMESSSARAPFTEKRAVAVSRVVVNIVFMTQI
jgi:hypothetical protein